MIIVVAVAQSLHTFTLLALIVVLVIDLLTGNGMCHVLCGCQIVVDVCVADGLDGGRARIVVVVDACREVVEVDDEVVCRLMTWLTVW